jgi:Domain of unknown function (DUF4335)
MTIRRQYSLPSCTLILDGLGNAPDGNNSRPLMSSLVNAECHLAGQSQPISGGMEFFQQLIATVSNYTQGMLSKIVQAPPSQHVGQVTLERGELENQHRLMAPGTGGSVVWNLSTVQLFDLVEAIDQFLADGSTLPELQVALRPAPKTASNQLARQAAPIGLGLSGLVATALAFAIMPTPLKVGAPVVVPTPLPSTQPAPSTKPSVPVSSNPAINNNATQVAFIKRKLRREISQNWEDRKGIPEKLQYKVSTNSAGEILKYEPIGELAKSKKELTPFPKLVPTPDTKTTNNLAEYTVGFTPNGALEINKFRVLKAAETLGATIQDQSKVQGLVAQVNTKVKLAGQPTFKQNLTYRVAADESGSIVDYEPLNQPAFDYEKETPLPQETKYDEQSAAGTKPLAQYTVTYQPNGMVKVDPRK